MNETQKVYKVEENRIFINGDGQITFLRSNTIEEINGFDLSYFPVYSTSITTTKHQSSFSASISQLTFLWF